MKAWKSGVALGATVLACTLGLITAGPASASGTVATAGGEAAVNFESYGEHFTVHDYKADGRATAGYCGRCSTAPGTNIPRWSTGTATPAAQSR
ncbi:hypothetical protein E4K10_04685 [Streptomyces sp. T1317-0309]|nr:hypothetical protein E4K10_04685 [Streptomyces sp. T1317-0309]